MVEGGSDLTCPRVAPPYDFPARRVRAANGTTSPTERAERTTRRETVADGFRYRRHVGLEVALAARREHTTDPSSSVRSEPR